MVYKCLLDYAATGTLLINGDCILEPAFFPANDQEPWQLTLYFGRCYRSVSAHSLLVVSDFQLSLRHFKALEHSDPADSLWPVFFTLFSR